MLPRDEVLAWREMAPWADEGDVEQDLIITRALFDIFGDPWLSERLAFRGGTALHRLYLQPPARYSEDIDLVQRIPEPIGPTFDRLRKRLSWIGKASSDVGMHPKLLFRFETGTGVRRKLKVEINTREHFGAVIPCSYAVETPVYSAATTISTYSLNELLGTKLRALYQRSKGRDLFDLWWARGHDDIDAEAIGGHFRRYMEAGHTHVPTAPEMRANLDGKQRTGVFDRIAPLLRADVIYNPAEALAWFEATFIPVLGDDDGVRRFGVARGG
jgi:predicted nucleotidyltransferase component of viral defense system